MYRIKYIFKLNINQIITKTDLCTILKVLANKVLNKVKRSTTSVQFQNYK